MATPSFHCAHLHGRQAYVLENDQLRLSVLRGGGHLGEIRLLRDDPRLALNPFYVPPYPTMEPYEFDPAQHGPIYGGGAHARLSAGYMGHLLCFPYFGPPSPAESELGFTFHGEAVGVEWREYRPAEVDAQGITLFYGADLPQTQFRVERAITLRPGETVVHVTEWIENLALFDRPYNRDQHATFGAPFVAAGKNMLDMSATTGLVHLHRSEGKELSSEGTVSWPDFTPSAGPIRSLRPFTSLPASTGYVALAADPARTTSYFTLYNVDYPLLVGYLFPTADNPWIIDWQEYHSNQRPPVLGQNVARGIEFGTTALGGGLRGGVERGSVLGLPNYRWISGRERQATSFTIFLSEIPPNFQGVADVQTAAGTIVVTEQVTGRRLHIAHAGAA